AHAQQLPAVAVRFEIAERSYRVELTAAELRDIEQRMGGFAAARLREQIGFSTFSTSQPAPYELRFTLDRRDRTSTGRDEMGFFAALHGPGLTPDEIYWLRFRGAD